MTQKKHGIKVLSMVLYLTPEGKYEIHMTVKGNKGQCVTTKEFASIIDKPSLKTIPHLT